MTEQQRPTLGTGRRLVRLRRATLRRLTAPLRRTGQRIGRATAIQTALLLAAAALFGLIAPHVLGAQRYAGVSRLPMFFAAVGWIIAEYVLQRLRTFDEDWDILGRSMSIARLGVAQYFGALILLYAPKDWWLHLDAPDWFWNLSRAYLGATGIYAITLLSREIVRGFHEATAQRRRRAVLDVVLFSVYLGVIALIW